MHTNIDMPFFSLDREICLEKLDLESNREKFDLVDDTFAVQIVVFDCI